MRFTDIKDQLKNTLKASRYEHTLGVEYTACCLAMRYGADMNQARIAGLLHDCAKNIPAVEKLRLAAEYGMDLSEYERENPELLHAKLGAVFARNQYDVEDEEILSAITWHTTGKPDMTLLEKIIYIADYMEPNRDHAPNLPEVRELAFQDLDACLLLILTDSVTYLNSRNIVIDPMTQKTYEYYRNLTN